MLLNRPKYVITLRVMIKAECEKCEGRGETHDLRCIVRTLIFNRDFKGRDNPHVTRTSLIETAVSALEAHIQRERKRSTKMTENPVVVTKPKKQLDLAAIDNFMVRADINSMNEAQIDKYVKKLCELVAINPITRPFDIFTQKGKKVIYANKGCAEQLRNIWHISIRIVKREVIEGVYTVTVAAQMGDRVDESTGCVWIEGIKGDERANAMMKAETKGKRRVTLSICGLNMPDDLEVDTIPNARRGGLSESPQSAPKEIDVVSRDQIVGLFSLGRARGIEAEDIKKILMNLYSLDSTKNLTVAQYKGLRETIEATPKKEVTSLIKPKAGAGALPWEKHLVK